MVHILQLKSYPPALLYAFSCGTLVFCIVANILISLGLSEPSKPDRYYSYLDDDFPEDFPVGALPRANIFVENTVHYQVNTTESDAEWESLFPIGGGYVHLGPQRRPFLLSMYHQIYCLRFLRDTMAAASLEKPTAQPGEAQHCLNYLRQAILCEPSLRLEPESERIKDAGLPIGVDGLELVHSECKDWTVVFRAVEENQQSRKEDTQ